MFAISFEKWDLEFVYMREWKTLNFFESRQPKVFFCEQSFSRVIEAEVVYGPLFHVLTNVFSLSTGNSFQYWQLNW